MFSLTKFVKICYNTHRKCGRPLPGGRRPGAPTGGPSAPAHLPRSRAFQARASWKAGAGSWNVVASWKLALERGCSWKLKLRRRSWKISRAASWENEGAAGRTVQLGARSWTTEGRRSWSYGENGACAVLQTWQLEAARGERGRASWTEGAAGSRGSERSTDEAREEPVARVVNFSRVLVKGRIRRKENTK